ncbi:hypothetical protein Misp06_01779 [Microbulbifer sp. NBRC 101763]
MRAFLYMANSQGFVRTQVRLGGSKADVEQRAQRAKLILSHTPRLCGLLCIWLTPRFCSNSGSTRRQQSCRRAASPKGEANPLAHSPLMRASLYMANSQVLFELRFDSEAAKLPESSEPKGRSSSSLSQATRLSSLTPTAPPKAQSPPVPPLPRCHSPAPKQ